MIRIATLQRQFDQGSHRQCDGLADGGEARRRAAAGDQDAPTTVFPRLEIEDLGYNVAIVGQKTYNGVAILSKHPLTVELTALPGDDGDDQARYVEGLIEVPRRDGTGHRDRARGLDLSAERQSVGHATSSPTSSPGWIGCGRMRRSCSRLEEVLVLGGDYNVAPTDADVYDPEGWRDDALCRPGVARRVPRRSSISAIPMRSARCIAEPHLYTFWDYQAGRWQRDEGLRIDHLLLSPQAADRLSAVRHRSRAARRRQAVGPHAGVVRAGGLAVAARSR